MWDADVFLVFFVVFTNIRTGFTPNHATYMIRIHPNETYINRIKRILKTAGWSCGEVWATWGSTLGAILHFRANQRGKGLKTVSRLEVSHILTAALNETWGFLLLSEQLQNPRGQMKRLNCSLPLIPGCILSQSDLFSCWETAPLRPPGASLDFQIALGWFFNRLFREKHRSTDPDWAHRPYGRWSS